MAEQKNVRRPEVDRKRDQEQANEIVARGAGAVATSEALKGELDDLLDEVDEVLEENAEEFVRAYVQKGGE